MAITREGTACGGAHDGAVITCEEYGYAIDSTKVWWIPETKELFTYEGGEFIPFDGPVIHGSEYSF